MTFPMSWPLPAGTSHRLKELKMYALIGFTVFSALFLSVFAAFYISRVNRGYDEQKRLKDAAKHESVSSTVSESSS